MRIGDCVVPESGGGGGGGPEERAVGGSGGIVVGSGGTVAGSLESVEFQPYEKIQRKKKFKNKNHKIK